MKQPIKIIDCTNCGACCEHMRTPPHIVKLHDGNEFRGYDDDVFGDFAHLMAAPQEARDVFIDGLNSDRPDNSPCSWLDPVTKRCRWWAYRPDVCRKFEVGEIECKSARRRLGIDPAGVRRFIGGRLVTQ